MDEAGSPEKYETIKRMSCKEYISYIESKINEEVRKRKAMGSKSTI